MSTIYVEPTVLQRPYFKRQMIVVTDDEVAAALNQAENKALVTMPGRSVAEIALSLVLPMPYYLVKIGKEIITTMQDAKDSGLQIFYVGYSEASKLLLPPGHPRPKAVYIGHPTVPEVYYTFAEFHRSTFEHKFSEAINLLMHLGATYIRVQHVHGWSKDFSSRLSVALGESSAGVSGEAGGTRYSGAQLLYEATFPGAKEAKLPETLVWFPHEPTWQAVANGRIEFSLQEFALNVAYEDDFGINADLKASAGKAGLDLGGKFEDHKKTMWRIDGRFRDEVAPRIGERHGQLPGR